MPYPRHMLESMRTRYGNRKAEAVINAFKRAHPKRFAKALRTARQRGHGGVAATSVTRRRLA